MSASRTGRPPLSTTACILQVRPPRDRPMACLLLRKSIFDISARNKGSYLERRRANLIQRQPPIRLFHKAVVQWRGTSAVLRVTCASDASGQICSRTMLPLTTHMVGRTTAHLTPAAPPSAIHPRTSRGPAAGGSGANPRVWRRGAWGRARADASSRAAPRPAGPRAHGSPR